MFIIYDLIFLVVALVTLPIYLFKRKLHRGMLARFGRLSADLKLDGPVWIHAVSVGEAMAIKGLLEELRKAFPHKRFVISTVTPTGNKIARSLAKDGDLVTYLPVDFSFIVKSVIRKISPTFFIIAETEIWPNLITYLFKQHIPVVVVNGRISDSSFKGYSLIKFLIRPILNKINLFCVQTERDAQRLKCLGVLEEKIRVTGNLKFDIADHANCKADYTAYRQKLGLGLADKVLVAGSTHPGEEEIILEVYKNLLLEFPSLRLLIAPRHPERAIDIEKLMIKFNFQPLRISQINLGPKARDLKPVFILDAVGQLLNYYAIADMVFVGGSLVKKGGHNILEPASLSKPVVFGPYMFNFQDIAALFLENNAAIQVRNPPELQEKIKFFLRQPEQAAALGRKARELVWRNQGATQKTCQYLKNLPGKIS
jgi:3-deoxy-D-manno-octulosonic-acid transferase